MKRIEIFGFNFISSDNWASAIKYIQTYKYGNKDNNLPFVITPNVDQIVKYERDNNLKSFFKNSFLILPDGQPIIWASHLLGKPLKKRLTGSDLFPLLWKEIKKRDEKCFFILSNKYIGEKLKTENSNITYVVPPIFSAENKKILLDLASNYSKLILEYKPKYVFIGLGFPKQEFLSMEIFKKLNKYTQNLPVFLLLGAAFEFYTGYKKRAPVLFQKIGLEWFYRFLQEPRRLFKRYFIDDLKFAKIVLKEFNNKST